MRHLGIVANPPGGLISAGPIVEVALSATEAAALALLRAGAPPAKIPIRLLVDTGAQQTCIVDGVLQQLGLVPIRFTPIIGVDAVPQDRPVYRAVVEMAMSDGSRNAVVSFEGDIVGIPSHPAGRDPGFVGLLGRDFLSYMRFTYTGPEGRFEIADFRSLEEKRTKHEEERRRNAEARLAKKLAKKARKRNR